MDFTVLVQGFESLDKAFANLPRSTQRKAIIPALREGGEVIRQAAEENLNAVTDSGYATGYAAKNLRVYNLRKYRGAYRVAVQVRRGAVNTKKIVNGEPVRVGLYVSVLEYGKENQPPRSWLRKAKREKESRAINVLTQNLNRGMVEAIQDAKR